MSSSFKLWFHYDLSSVIKFDFVFYGFSQCHSNRDSIVDDLLVLCAQPSRALWPSSIQSIQTSSGSHILSLKWDSNSHKYAFPFNLQFKYLPILYSLVPLQLSLLKSQRVNFFPKNMRLESWLESSNLELESSNKRLKLS